VYGVALTKKKNFLNQSDSNWEGANKLHYLISTTNWSEVWNLWKSESIHSDVLVTSLTEI
jgi:hypothetical protein